VLRNDLYNTLTKQYAYSSNITIEHYEHKDTVSINIVDLLFTHVQDGF